MALLISLRGATTLTEGFAVLTAVNKRYGRERSRSGGMKWRKDSSTRRRFVAEFAGVRSKNKARRLDACICRESNGKNRRKRNQKQRNPHDIQLPLVSLGGAVGHLCVVDGNLRENRSRRSGFGFRDVDPDFYYSFFHRVVCLLHRQVERS